MSGMALRLPGERQTHFLGALLAAAAVLGLCALGCATPARTRRYPSSILEAARFRVERARPIAPGHPRHSGVPAERAGDEGAAFVERALHHAGFRFGTDGSTRALWGYLRSSHVVVSAGSARPGDILFFDTRGVAPAPTCADHAGIVESVSPDGRIAFVEARGGRTRRSFVDPARPTARRDERGEILNTFLRPKAIDDPPGARYFAGEMLCGVARTTSARVTSATRANNDGLDQS
jgi:hypothetical protein